MLNRIFCLFALSITCLLSAEEYQFTGVHYLASFLECDRGALCDLPRLREAMVLGVEKSGATLLKSADYIFSPDAMTMVLLLSESHASIHTYPEHAACYIDFFTCGERCDYTQFEKVLCDYLSPGKVDSSVIKR